MAMMRLVHADEESGRGATVLALVLLSAMAALLEIATTGFEFGVSNNVYHIPIVLGYATLPQFADDAYYQTFRYYTSLVWPALRLIATPANIYWVFLACYVVSVWLYFLALLHVVSRIVSVGWFGLALAAMILASSHLDSGYSRLAGHDLVPGYFTQTPLATPIVAFGLALCMRGRIAQGVALTGLVFDINAFVAVWATVALLAVSIWLVRHGSEMRVLARDWLIGGCTALLLASPVLVWMAAALGSTGRFQGDYVAYLRWFYPNHYLIDSASAHQIVLFVAAAVLAGSALVLLGREGRMWSAALLGFLAVFGFGCIAPVLTHDPLVFDLHPLRADGFVQILATVASVALIVRDLSPNTTRMHATFAVCIAAGLLLSRYLLPLAALMMLSRALGLRRPSFASYFGMKRAWATGIVLSFVAVACVVRETRPLNWLEPEPWRNPDFVALTAWAKAATGPFSIFLLNGERNSIFDKFQMMAQRRVWVDMRQGAAVTWSPGFYAHWHPRAEAVWSLRTEQERLAFSCREKLDYYVDETSADLDLDRPDIRPYVAFRSGKFFAIDSGRYCAAKE